MVRNPDADSQSGAAWSERLQRDRERLDEIEHAMARLASGRYGICEDCGGEIPRARLLAQPVAVRCTDCQAMVEARARH